MHRTKSLPSAFKRFAKMGGVLDFAIFEDAEGTEQDVVNGLPEALRHPKALNTDKLQALGYKRLNMRSFLGDWCDPKTGALLKVGQFTPAQGRDLVDPTLEVYERANVVSGGGKIPVAGAGGQFAYAFSCPPYRLQAKASAIQSSFDEIRDFVSPSGTDTNIWDWSNPMLPEISEYFAAGMEWWGVYLFSIHVPAKRRLTIIAGSATD